MVKPYRTRQAAVMGWTMLAAISLLGVLVPALNGCGGGASHSSTAQLNLRIPTEDEIMDDSATGEKYVRGILLAYAKPDASEQAVQQAVATIDGRIVGSIPQIKLYQIQVNAAEAEALRQLAETLKAHPAIENAFLDTLLEAPVIEEEDIVVELEGEERSRLYPNDYNKKELWYMELINAPAAWDITRGSRKHSQIAIIDSGFDVQHEDLRDNISLVSQLATSGNTLGWQNHGTAVAGLAGAVGGNSRGITGVCWFASLKLFGLGAVTSNEGESLQVRSLFLGAIVLAADSGARVINLSLGAGPYDEAQRRQWENLMRPAFLYAKNRGVLFVIAAGNDNKDASQYVPKSFAADSVLKDHVLVVGACTKNGGRAESTNWGSIVEIAAPGGTPMQVPLPGNMYGTAFPTEGKSHEVIGVRGTSFAAPLVAGTAGLLLSVNPNLSAPELKRLLIEGAKKGGRFYSDDHGNQVPILNAAWAVNLASGNRYAIPNLSANQMAFAQAPANVTFDARSSVLTNEVASILLDFGDGTPPKEFTLTDFVANAVVTHTYSERGRYVAKLIFYRDRERKQVLASTTLTIFVGEGSVSLIIS